MKKQRPSKTSYPEAWDDGTYSTGSTRPPKNSNPLVALLLCAVIFLGGIASALGLINIQLFLTLQQSMEPTLPIALHTGPSKTDQAGPNAGETEPGIPENSLQELPLAAENTLSAPAQDVYALASRSMVAITAYDSAENGTDYAGVVLSEDGFILTNASALDDAQRIYVTLADGEMCRAALVGSDPLTDLAVLYISTQGLIPAEFADSTLSAGRQVVFVGENRQGKGIISANVAQVLSGGRQLQLLQTNAADNSRGGVIFSTGGQVVGILCPKFADFLNKPANSAGFVLPSSHIKPVVDQLLRNGFVAGRPGLGVKAEEVTDLYQDYWKIPNGLLITSADDESGLQEGDILLSINGIAVNSDADLNRVLFSQSVGRQVTAVVYRDGTRICLELTLREHIPALSRR
ncbi:MAG: serine protease [Oscillospiraceae bacterium]|nr:serine protease [Oscillospiraceae bacterium]